MKTVIHIGADQGEIEYYEEIGCKNLTYVEPDKACLIKLKANASKHFQREQRSLQHLKIIPKACSSERGSKLKFYANGNGQSSVQKPGPYTKAVIEKGNRNFQEYEVETTTLKEIYNESLKDSNQIDYLCIDTQGHEKSILCPTPSEFLSEMFSIIDVELMTDQDMYEVDSNAWVETTMHLINSGFVPLIHPQGITESYIFLNSKHGKWIENIAKPIADSVARNLTKQLYKSYDAQASDHICSHASILGNNSFLPLGITGGSINMTQIQSFREEFIKRASLITPAQYELITS